jgi:hypothetical protein
MRLTVLAASAVVLLLLAATAAPASTERRCGVAGSAFDAPQDVRALGVSCRTARALARKHSRNDGRNDVCDLAKPSCRLDGWSCKRTFFGNSGTRVRCLKGAARVRFFYGT